MSESTESIFVSGTPFHETQSFSRCQELAKKAIDLTNPKVLTQERIKKMTIQGPGITYLYGFERVDDHTIDTLTQLAKERCATDQMHAMQNGYLCNFLQDLPSENRAVLHTAMRDIFTERPCGDAAITTRNQAKQENEKLKEFMETINQENRFCHMVFIGIGGSELGPKALYQGLSGMHRKDRSIHFICNVDPDDVAQAVKDLDLQKTLVVVISKSGTTLETTTNEEFVRSYFVKNNINPKNHFISVTMPGTPMDNRDHYLQCFHIWDCVGGRYSATSMVGGILLSFGISYDAFFELLRGAHDMDVHAMQTHVRNNMPLMAALIGIWNRNFLNYPTVAVIPYAQMLHRFPAHLQQCDMESNGKHVNRHGQIVSYATGPIIWGEPGTNAQHSFYQLIHQGTDIVPLELIGFQQSQCNSDFLWQNTTSQEKLLSNLIAQAIALATGKDDKNPNKQFTGNRPCSLLIGKKLTPYTLGALLSFYEHKIAFQGFLWGINSFDQEGVQLGKVLADKTLKLFEKTRSKSSAEPFELGQTLIDIIQSL